MLAKIDEGKRRVTRLGYRFARPSCMRCNVFRVSATLEKDLFLAPGEEDYEAAAEDTPVAGDLISTIPQVVPG